MESHPFGFTPKEQINTSVNQRSDWGTGRHHTLLSRDPLVRHELCCSLGLLCIPVCVLVSSLARLVGNYWLFLTWVDNLYRINCLLSVIQWPDPFFFFFFFLSLSPFLTLSPESILELKFDCFHLLKTLCWLSNVSQGAKCPIPRKDVHMHISPKSSPPPTASFKHPACQSRMLVLSQRWVCVFFSWCTVQFLLAPRYYSNGSQFLFLWNLFFPSAQTHTSSLAECLF